MEHEDKMKIVTALRKETGCGLMCITRCLDSLIEALKHPPVLKMDVGYRLNMEWEEYDLRKMDKHTDSLWTD